MNLLSTRVLDQLETTYYHSIIGSGTRCGAPCFHDSPDLVTSPANSCPMDMILVAIFVEEVRQLLLSAQISLLAGIREILIRTSFIN